MVVRKEGNSELCTANLFNRDNMGEEEKISIYMDKILNFNKVFLQEEFKMLFIADIFNVNDPSHLELSIILHYNA